MLVMGMEEDLAEAVCVCVWAVSEVIMGRL